MWGFDRTSKEVDFGTVHGTVNLQIKLQQPAFPQRMAQVRNNDNADDAMAGAPTVPTEQPVDTLVVGGSLAASLQAERPPDGGAPAHGGEGGLSGGDITGDSGDSIVQGGPGFGRGGFGGRGQGGGRRGGNPARAPSSFGNRASRQNRIRGMASFTLNNSAVNAKPFSLNGLDMPQAAYAQSRFSLMVGGPAVIPHVLKDPSTQFFLTYFGTRGKTPRLFAETVPTAAERVGDFSGAVQSLGASNRTAAVTLVNPFDKQPFQGNRIPPNLLNAQALALLKFYPLPNYSGLANNYQFETAQASNTDSLGVRLQRNVTTKDRLALNVQFQDRNGRQAEPFGYSDATSGYGLNTQLQWTRNLAATAINTFSVRFNRNRNEVSPYFSALPNVASELGIAGASSNPIDNGPPTLNFTNFAALSDAVYSLSRNQTQGATETVSLVRGKHAASGGFSFARADLATITDPNGRGTFNFTGQATSAYGSNGQPVAGSGYDLADFLLGLPQSASIRYGDAATYFAQNQCTAYAQDEWRARPDLTITAGVRYEFFAPWSEKYRRMANLDIAPGFANVAVVTPNTAGAYTGRFPSGLIDPDRNSWAPRVALAWRVPSKKSTVFRAGYGIYYNEQAYVQLAQQLAQQPPFAVSNAVNTSVQDVLTLGPGFRSTAPGEVTNTYAVDRNYRTPYVQSWNANLQRDLGAGMFVEVGYQGSKGTRLDVRTLPNEPPPGSIALRLRGTQLGDAVGFTFDQSVGNSTFHALQTRFVRRFNRGLSINAFYQFAKSIDDSSTFGGAGNTVAQNWLDISAERGLSSFDVRHQLQASAVWTSPAGSPKSAISGTSVFGRLLKDWQISGSVTAQTGNPLTARALGNTAQLAQTGGIGRERAEATGESVSSGSGVFNVDAFTIPPAGQYGNAARNTIPGPSTFSVNAAVARSFSFAERRRLEFRIEANNVLNHVNYTNLYTVVNAIDYGLPSAAGPMRSMNAVVRFRF